MYIEVSKALRITSSTFPLTSSPTHIWPTATPGWMSVTLPLAECWVHTRVLVRGVPASHVHVP